MFVWCFVLVFLILKVILVLFFFVLLQGSETTNTQSTAYRRLESKVLPDLWISELMVSNVDPKSKQIKH